MAKKLVIIALIIVMLGPTAMLVSIGVLLNPASNAACTTNDGATLQIGDVPDSLQGREERRA